MRCPQKWPMSDNPSIVIIIEGYGEVNAAPGLVWRILHERLYRFDISRLGAKRANGKPDLLKRLEKFLIYAVIDNFDAVIVLLDAEDDCPFQEVVNLVDRAVALNLSIPVAVVYAKSEYETWFISSLSEDRGEGIRAHLNIDQSINAPENVEGIRGAKEWIERYMPSDQRYKETADQEPLTHHIHLDIVYSRSRSFRRLCHAVEELVKAMDNSMRTVTPRIR